jgi:hypothetical protein
LDVEGQILAGDGLPMAGVRVATSWSGQRGAKVESDNDGRYRIKLDGDAEARAIVAMTSDQRWGAIAPVQSATKTLEGHWVLDLTLEPLVLLQGRMDWQPIEGALPETEVSISVLPSGARIAKSKSESGVFRFLLPPGRYRLDANAQGEHRAWTETLVVADLALDLGQIEVAAHPLTQFYGEVPPSWTVTGTRNAPADVTLQTYAGKWVVLVVWDASDPKSFTSLLPHLTKFYESHAAQRDSFEIVALHGPAIGSFELLDEKAPKGTKPPSFPVLIDQAGDTAKAYGIETFPSLLLLDPEARLVRRGSLRTLEHTLRD